MELLTEEKQKLDDLVAYVKNHPIRTANEMEQPITCKPMDEAWKERITDQFWATNYNGDIEKKFKGSDLEWAKLSLKIRDKLLTLGGDEACLPVLEEDATKILKRGQLWYGDRIKMIKGEPCHCHYNAQRIWWEEKKKGNDNIKIATGYALSEDGMWRQHSWCVLVRPRKNQIIETTVKRVAYFGFALTDEEAELFSYYNA